MAAYTVTVGDGATYAAQQVADGATNRWHLTEASGNLTDDIGGVVATKVGSPTYQQRGIFGAGEAIRFNANGSVANYFTIPSIGSGITQWTFEAWAYATPDSYLNSNGNSELFRAANSDGVRIIMRPNGIYADVAIGGTTYLLQPGLAVGAGIGGWNHLVVVRNGATLSVYRDGVLMGGGSRSDLPAGGNSFATTTLGAYPAGGSGFQGYADDVALYNGVALSAAQILDHFQRGPELGRGDDGFRRTWTPARATPDQAQSQDETINLITNPQLEVGATGWAHWFGSDTQAYDAADSVTGSGGSFASTKTAGTENFNGVAFALPLANIAEGFMTAAVWVKSSVACTMRMDVRNSTSTFIVSSGSQAVTADTWTRFVVSGWTFRNNLANTNLIFVAVRTDASNFPNGSVMKFDQAQVHFHTGVTPPYFDPIVNPDARWLGSANASQSALPRVARATGAARTPMQQEWADGQDEQYRNWLPSDLAASLGHYAQATGAGMTGQNIVRSADAPANTDVTVPGSAALTATSTGTPNAGCYVAILPFPSANIFTDGMPVVPGQTVYVSAFYKIANAPAGADARITLYVANYDVSGVLLSYSVAAVTSTPVFGDWAQISGKVVLPANTQWAGARIQMTEAAGVGNLAPGAWELRVAGLYLGARPSSFFSGSSGAGGSWTGTAEASPSVKGAAMARVLTGARALADAALGVEGGSNLLSPATDVSGEGPFASPGWVIAGTNFSAATFNRDTSWASHGSGALRVGGNLAPGGGYSEVSIYLRGANGNLPDIQTYGAPVTPGLTYVARCDYRQNVNASRGPQIYLRWQDASGVMVSQIASAQGSAVAGTTGTMTISGVAPAGARWASVLLLGSASSAPASDAVDVSFDAVGVYLGSTAPSPYDYARPLGRTVVQARPGATATPFNSEDAVAQDGELNYLTNPRFAAGTPNAGWQFYDGTSFSAPFSAVADGPAGLPQTGIEFTTVGPSGGYVFQNASTGPRIQPGQPVAASIWLKFPDGMPVNSYAYLSPWGRTIGLTGIEGAVPSAGATSRVDAAGYVAGTWVQLWGVVTPPTGAHSAQLLARLSSAFTGGYRVRASAAVFTTDPAEVARVQAGQAPAYFDGSLPDTLWLGTAHASRSLRTTVGRSTSTTRAATDTASGQDGAPAPTWSFLVVPRIVRPTMALLAFSYASAATSQAYSIAALPASDTEVEISDATPARSYP